MPVPSVHYLLTLPASPTFSFQQSIFAAGSFAAVAIQVIVFDSSYLHTVNLIWWSLISNNSSLEGIRCVDVINSATRRTEPHRTSLVPIRFGSVRIGSIFVIDHQHKCPKFRICRHLRRVALAPIAHRRSVSYQCHLISGEHRAFTSTEFCAVIWCSLRRAAPPRGRRSRKPQQKRTEHRRTQFAHWHLHFMMNSPADWKVAVARCALISPLSDERRRVEMSACNCHAFYEL